MDKCQWRCDHCDLLMDDPEICCVPPTPTVAADAAASSHTDDAAVDEFAAAMKEKLAQARTKGRSGWEQCSPEDLSRVLRDHVEKGDPRDVANFCMFLWSLEAPISKVAQPDERAAPTDSIPLHEDMLRALEHVECVYRLNVVREGEPSSTLANLQRVIARALAIALQATDERVAFDLPPLPAPLEIDWPELHSQALGCGVEDRNILDRYEAAEYGWQDGVDRAVERVPEEIFTADQMREYALAAVARATAPQAGATLTEEVISEAVKKWFPDRSYQASFFARALLSQQAEK